MRAGREKLGGLGRFGGGREKGGLRAKEARCGADDGVRGCGGQGRVGSRGFGDRGMRMRETGVEKVGFGCLRTCGGRVERD